MAERIPLYLDFENGKISEFAESDTMPVGNQFQFPIGYVVMNTDNSDPADLLGYGSWNSLGSGTIGVTTVYYYERIAP